MFTSTSPNSLIRRCNIIYTMKSFNSRGFRKLPSIRVLLGGQRKSCAKSTQKSLPHVPQSVPSPIPVSDDPVLPTVTSTPHELLNQTVLVLINVGLYHYFCTRNKSEDDCRRIVQRCATFILWSYHEHHDDQLLPTSTNVTEWFKALANRHYSLLLPFSTYLQVYKHHQPSTVKNWLGDIESCFLWSTLFAPASIKLPMNTIEGIKAVSRVARSNQSKLQRQKRSTRTLQELVRTGKVPPGGLPQMQNAVIADLPWARRIRAVDLDKTAYARFMELLFGALYVFSPQGRQSGVADMKFAQVDQLLTHKFATSTKFKTRSKYGYQPVTLYMASLELFELYVNKVRPQVRRAHIDGTEEPLWLHYDGTLLKGVGKHVTRYFKRTLRVSTSTTIIRSLVETEVDQMHKRGVISGEQRIAVQNINGHTSETTRAYYLMEDRAADVLCTEGVLTSDIDALMEVFAEEMSDDELRGPPLPPPAPAAPHMRVSRPPPLPLPTWTAPQAQVLDWGTRHPDYATTKATATWTHEEKQYVGTWCANYRLRYPESSNAVAQCLKHIQRDPEAIAIFHKFHTLDCTRLRNGQRQYEKERLREGQVLDVLPDMA